MIPRFPFLGVLLGSVAAVSCGRGSYTNEEFSRFYPQRSEAFEQQKLGQRKVLGWGADPRQKELLGWLEEWRVKPSGTREWRTVHHLYEPRGVTMIGFITENGTFHRFGRDGRAEKLGEWKVIETGLKVFFRLPLDRHLGFEELDPYSE